MNRALLRTTRRRERFSPTELRALRRHTRLKGQPGWKVAIARRSKFPWDDDSALAQPGVPETREYRAIGVLDDKEIGQPSDIVEVVYAG